MLPHAHSDWNDARELCLIDIFQHFNAASILNVQI